MRTTRPSRQIATQVIGKDDDINGKTYDELMPMFSDDGRFDPKALDTLAKSFVELKVLPAEPDMSKLYTEAFLPPNEMMQPMCYTTMRCSTLAAARCSALVAAGTASAETTLRLGKAQPNQFAFVPADVGVETGIFKKHGIDLEISSFAGDAKEMQALTAGSIDIALGGGPAFATSSKACR